MRLILDDSISNFSRGVPQETEPAYYKDWSTPENLYSPIAEHPGVYLIKQSQF